MQDAESLEEWQQQRIERYQRRIQYLLSQGIEVNEPVGLDEYISEDDLEDINDLGNFESVPELDTVIEPPPIEPPCPAIDSFLPQFNAYVLKSAALLLVLPHMTDILRVDWFTSVCSRSRVTTWHVGWQPRRRHRPPPMHKLRLSGRPVSLRIACSRDISHTPRYHSL